VINNTDHTSMVTGTFSCGALSQDPFMALHGRCKFFSEDPCTPGTKNISYDIDIVRTDGDVFHFNGYSVIDDSIAIALWQTWRATLMLYITLTHLKDNWIMGCGVMHVADLRNEIASFSATGSALSARVGATQQLLAYYTKQIAMFFFVPLSDLFPQRSSSRNHSGLCF
jgi:hypothetical protein